MNIQVREGVFETNSSSTHAVSVCTLNEFEDFKKGKMYVNMNNLEIVSKEFADKINDAIKEECEKYGYDYEDTKQNEGCITWSEFMDIDYEIFHKARQLKDGTTMVAFGYFGYDY